MIPDFDYLSFLPPELRIIPWRAHPLDGKLLLFHRETGLNLLLEGEETAHLTRIAPRTLLVAITNACNLTCHFCYRDLENRSLWRYETLMQFCQEADKWGVLEVACLAKGTPVFGPDGMVEIQDLSVGDCIYDSQGVPRTVVNITSRLAECVSLKGNKGWQIVCTPDHPFVVHGRLVQAKDTHGLVLDQIMPLSCEGLTSISLLPYVLPPRKAGVPGGQTGGKVKNSLCKLHSRCAWIPHRIELSEEVMWLYGISVAEGSKRGLALNLKERDLAEKASSIYKLITGGLNSTIRRNTPVSNTLVVEFQHSKVYRTIFFDAMEIGYGASLKSIKFLFKLDSGLIRAALRGMFDGDGCYRTKANGKFTDFVLSYKTSSKSLAYELTYLLYNRVGVYASLHCGRNQKRQIEGRDLPETTYYQVEIYGKQNIQRLFPDAFEDSSAYQQIGNSIYSSNKNHNGIQVMGVMDAGIHQVYDITLDNDSTHVFPVSHGVLTHNCGGGEPMLFPQWTEFINELYDTTGLCLNFTTNGTLLTGEFLKQISGKYGQIRVSLYEDNHWRETLKLLVANQARFGVNWLITPAELPGIEQKFGELLSLGVRDFLMLSYKGEDTSLHFRREHYRQFADFVNKAYQKLGSLVTLKLDICFGGLLPDVPRLFTSDDCGAGDEFLSITSDKHIKACSFQQTNTGIPFETIADLRQIWQRRRAMRQTALTGGCARLPNRGLTAEGVSNAFIPLAAVQQQP